MHQAQDCVRSRALLAVPAPLHMLLKLAESLCEVLTLRKALGVCPAGKLAETGTWHLLWAGRQDAFILGI